MSGRYGGSNAPPVRPTQSHRKNKVLIVLIPHTRHLKITNKMHKYNRDKGPKYSHSATRAKAPPTQQCQKCLEFGHYTYDCKAERVYKARPTRTQQLKKPIKRQEVEVPEEFLPK
ncbi:hypothetical protein BGZ65_001192, partial [Modicella reniformis]